MFETADTLTCRHAFFGRTGGVSDGIYASLNCGPGSHDDPDSVLENRRIVSEVIAGRRDWPLLSLYQIHSNKAVTVTSNFETDRPKADAMVTSRPGLALGILTADCTPILFEDLKNKVIGAAHAGWRGAVSGIIPATLAAMEALGAERSHIRAATGPTIQQDSYEVGTDMHTEALKAAAATDAFFRPGSCGDHYQFDLPGFIAHQLACEGIKSVWQSPTDTYTSALHFSYRRSTHLKEDDYGRQVSAIML